MQTMMTIKVVRDARTTNFTTQSTKIYKDDPNMAKVNEEIVKRRNSSEMMQSVLDDSVKRSFITDKSHA